MESWWLPFRCGESLNAEKGKSLFALNIDPPAESLPGEKGTGRGGWFLLSAYFGRNGRYLKVLLIFLSVFVPLALLYGINAESFNHTYNGRSYYLFFVWLIVLEFAFSWNKYDSKLGTSRRGIFVFGLALILPTLYVVVANFLNLNGALIELARPSGVGAMWLSDIPLAVELLVFAVFFAVIFSLAYKRQGLTGFSPAIALLAAIGVVNMITIFFPYGGFTPFQLLCPPTASASASVLELMGFNTMVLVNPRDFMPTLFVSGGAQSVYAVNIGWPCAGVDSLIIYSVVMLVFLKKAAIRRLQGAVYFGVGAAVTFFINVLRVVTISLIGLNQGDIRPFHNYYGQLYSAIWIVSYLLFIIGSRMLWDKYRAKKIEKLNLKNAGNLEPAVL
jgi:thaumarchaeosortase